MLRRVLDALVLLVVASNLFHLAVLLARFLSECRTSRGTATS